MPLLTGSDTLNTVFTPAAVPFICQATGAAPVFLERRNVTAAPWAVVAQVSGLALVIDNPVAGAEYRFTSTGGTTTVAVRADQ
jgi:hypothetical protein